MSQLRDLTPPPRWDDPPPRPPLDYQGGYPRSRRERRQRTWHHKLLGALAMYGLLSLVIHAVVIYELTH